MTQYTAKVYGISWEGFRANTEYVFSHRPTRAEVLDRSGDFQHVTRVCLTATTTTTERLRFEQKDERE